GGGNRADRCAGAGEQMVGGNASAGRSGALHRGHEALILRATELSDSVVVSIFVNRLQFNVASDYDKYPRPIEQDLEICQRLGVAAVYAPTNDSMYPDDFDTVVSPGELAKPMEGSARPGHFIGMATVVAKLFNATKADVAIFGEKDYQQLAIVRSMVTDLNMGIEIVGYPTVRESDGLALSSRNQRLAPNNRLAAGVIPTALQAAKDRFERGERDSRILIEMVNTIIGREDSARIDYVEIADVRSLQSVVDIKQECVLAVAVFFGDVRLIDNIVLKP
ncbi:MAG: pantoate--beta-alanine ligase, partial [Actinobacteria bacterium]|nr:pantoate--beta-alanine ligase [Actinomycetota bacterium]